MRLFDPEQKFCLGVFLPRIFGTPNYIRGHENMGPPSQEAPPRRQG